MNKKIVVTFRLDEKQRAELEQTAPGCRICYTDGSRIPPDLMRQANVIFGNPDPGLLASAEHLEWIQLGSAGADGYPAGTLPKGAVLTNASGAYGPSIGEYMVCVAMSLMLDLPRYRDNQKEHRWKNSHKVRHIPGSVALSVGFGGIGREFAKRYHALGGHVIGVKRTAGEKPDYLDGLHTTAELDSLLPRADVVALSLPSTPETRYLFGKEKFARMKRDAILVNVGRGTAVDTGDLCEALRSGKIGGAALDVTDPEPLPADSPLWDLPNVIVTPHVSGGWDAPENFGRVFRISMENLGRYLRGEPLTHRVSLRLGY
ncbi:MAG: D-2-hydroxyacid dehydrogenase [Oscillospiraceae bacterium]|jgi:phosphoglycerate dehydrogenase-like enzyme|nr:D-2-hydroxyacid dehydrogenase [Oscillospiraceae bacterium]MCI1991224.1 D-2-hydroxyacid dehydrogenase [Oscillospiraceae bacterium]MCI2035606.1 D-2-hydroxyacid dehydrogenase [Oscillospiraceae bacterium]